MDFALWRTIGNQTLIKSNINNWLVCKEGSGSILQQKDGSLSCEIVKKVVPKKCAQQEWSASSYKTRSSDNGPYIFLINYYYFFDGSTDDRSPVHNPCTLNFQENHLKGVVVKR